VANEISLKIKVGDDGSLKIVAKDAQTAAKNIDKVASSTDKAASSRNRYQKQEKGAAGITSNSTKAFAKQAQTIGGEGAGLVGAYATLAANVFAVTAAFGVLQRAAQFKQLTQGLETIGRASGLAMTTLANGLIDATDAALSLEEAMRATITVTSAGLDPSKVEALGKAAKNASNALGRDLQDSIQRLTRGITKLEPELLDELGIFTRIEPAAEAYARQLGKNASELTNFQKRQAFANAVLKEAEEKFGAIGNSVQSNPYDRLAATFQNVTTNALELINTALTPLVSLLAASPYGLLGVLLAFGSGLVSQIVPSLKSTAEAASALSKDYAEKAQKAQKVVSKSYTDAKNAALESFRKIEAENNKSGNKSKIAAASVKNIATGYEKAADKSAFLAKNTKLLENSEKQRLPLIKRLREERNQEKHLLDKQGIALKTLTLKEQERLNKAKEVLDEKEKELAVVRKLIKESKNLKEQGKRSSVSSEAGTFASRSSTSSGLTARGIKEIDKADGVVGKLRAGLKYSKLEFKNFGKALQDSRKQTGLSVFSMNTLKLAFKTTGSAAKIFGTALLSVIPMIGAIVAAVTSAYAAIKWFLDSLKSEETKTFEKNVKQLSDGFEDFNKNLKEIDNSIQGNSLIIATVTARYEALFNTLDSFDGLYQKLKVQGVSEVQVLKSQEEALLKVIKGSAFLTKRFEENTKTIVSSKKTLKEKIGVLEDFVTNQKNAASSVRAFAEATRASRDIVIDFFKSFEVKTPFDNLSAQVSDVANTLSGLDTGSMNDNASIIVRALNEEIAGVLGVAEQRANLAALNDKIAKNEEGQLKKIEALKAKRDAKNFGKSTFKESPVTRLRLGIQIENLENSVARARKEQADAAEGLLLAATSISLVNSKELSTAVSTLKLSKTTLNASQEELNVLKSKRQISVKNTADIINAEENLRQAKIKTLKAENLALKATQRGLDQNSNRYKNIQNTIDANTSKITTLNNAELKGYEKVERVFNTLNKLKKAGSDASIASLKKELEAIETNETFSVDKVRNTIAIKNKINQAERANLAEQIQLQSTLVTVATAQNAPADELNRLQTKLLVLKAKDLQLQDSFIEKGEEVLELRRTALALATIANAKDEEYGRKLGSAGLTNTLAVFKLQKASTLARADELALQDAINTKTEKQSVLEELKLSVLKSQTAELQLQEQIRAKEIERRAASLDKVSSTAGTSIRNTESIKLADDKVAELKADEKTDPKVLAAAEAEATKIKIGAASDAFKAISEDMAKIGPEGELMSAATGGVSLIADTFTTAFDVISDSSASMSDKVQAGLAAGMAVMQTFAAVSKASSDAKIRGIDQEIAAEKKRDGQSAQSLAKISALEKKKEKEQRKAFEVEKKMKMGQTIISTAQGAMAAYTSLAAIPIVGPALGAAAAAMVVAMGAKQLSMISSTSFQGGGSTGGASAPASISVGSRTNTTDLAKSTGGAGELGYFRGQSGVGGPENFTPAFTGMKYRASGGQTTGFMVGEQGPELFVPEKPGRIVPADEVGSGGAVNANITIQAVDADGVEDVLRRQRGNIIGMLREAANANGENFLESVNLLEQ
jgi:hypothetical protein